MRPRRLWGWGATVAGFFASSALASVQRLSALAAQSLVDVLVWGADMKIDVTRYAPDVKAQIEQLRQRSQAYQSKRGKPTGSSELKMAYNAQVRYERPSRFHG
jgi:hypothetical protein